MESGSSENCWQRGLWIIQGNRNTEKKHIALVFFFYVLLTAAKNDKQNPIHLHCTMGEVGLSKPGRTTRGERESTAFKAPENVKYAH